jgi:hypothetical protein
MPTAPSLSTPRLGEPISAASVGSGDDLSYVKRASALKQVSYWNEVLTNDPVFGPACGLSVGVAPVKDRAGHWPLVRVVASGATCTPWGYRDPAHCGRERKQRNRLSGSVNGIPRCLREAFWGAGFGQHPDTVLTKFAAAGAAEAAERLLCEAAEMLAPRRRNER